MIIDEFDYPIELIELRWEILDSKTFNERSPNMAKFAIIGLGLLCAILMVVIAFLAGSRQAEVDFAEASKANPDSTVAVVNGSPSPGSKATPKPKPKPTLEATPEPAPISTPKPTPPPQWATEVYEVIRGGIDLKPGQYNYYRFSVQTLAKIAGNFSAIGGMNNDVNVLILDEDGFSNWRNRNRYHRFYESGQVTVGTIDMDIAPGQYLLVFENRNSIISSKRVFAAVTVKRTCQKLHQ